MNNGKRGGMAFRLFTSVWRRKWFLLLCAALVAAYVAISGVSSQLSKATGYIKLNYSSAHDGLKPNGARFNIYDIKQQALMEKALQITGLENALTWRELDDCLSVSPSRTQSVSKRYIASEYTATLKYIDAFGGVSARSMLEVIYRLYYEDFLNQSAISRAQLGVDWQALDDMEFIEAGEYAQSRADILRQFLLNRINQSSGYESGDASTSFRALLSTVETYESVYIGKYMALVEQGHLFKDPEAYNLKLTYQRMLINQDYQLSRAQYAIREQTIADYQESMAAVVMVPTYYSGNGLYMSRTQTGIDTLTNDAEKYSLISQKQALKLANIDKEIASLKLANAANAESAEKLLSDVIYYYDKLAESVLRADEAYIEFTARDYMKFTPRDIGLMDAYAIKDAFLLACATVFILSLSFFMYDTRKRSRRAASVKGGDAK